MRDPEMFRLVGKAIHNGQTLEQIQADVAWAYAEQSKNTDTVSRLRRGGKTWFFLGLERGDAKLIEGVTRYWLNPMEQHSNHSGYFTEQELIDWIDDKGPIPKAPKVSR